jgi:hypothetical protein
MGEKSCIIKIPASTRVICHDVGLSCNVVMDSNVMVMALVEGIEAQEVRARCRGRRGTLDGPRQGASVVCRRPDGAFGNWMKM